MYQIRHFNPATARWRRLHKALTLSLLLALLAGLLPGSQPATPVLAAPTAASYTVTTTLTTTGAIWENQTVNVAVQISNTGSDPLVTLPLQESYDRRYLAYASASVAANDNVDDGQIDWSDLTGAGSLAVGQSLTVNLTFTAMHHTQGLAAQSPCTGLDATCTVALVNGAQDSLGSSGGSVSANAGVGILPAPDGKATLGDYVWRDVNHDGLKAGEVGINGVLVNLYLDGANGNPQDGVIQSGEFYTSTTTHTDNVNSEDSTSHLGYYDFPVAGGFPYIVEVAPSNFTSGPLVGMVNSNNGGANTQVKLLGPSPVDENDADFGYYQPVGGIQVSKQVVTSDSSAVPGGLGTFTINVSCPGSSPTPSASQTVSAGGSVTFSNILSGTLCTISENTLTLPAAPLGYTWVNQQVTPNQVTVVNGATANVTVRNTLAPQLVPPTDVLTITKTISGTGSGPFNITIIGPSGYSHNTTINPGTPVVLTGLVSGVYTVTETSPGAGWTTVYTATPGTGGSSNAVVTLQNANTATLATTAITGKVFRDFNSDGLITANGMITDTGVSGVKVTAYDKNGNTVGNATSAANGTYTINPTGAGPYRVAFSNLPSGYEPTTHGSQNGTSTQFVTTAAGATGVNFGIVQPCDYCQSNPNLVTTKYVNGDPLLTSKPGGGSVFYPTKDFPAWIQFPYSSGATGAAVGNNSPPASGTTAYTTLSNAGPIGTLWGLAYQRESKRMFGAAVVRRHAGLGPLGTGGIYMADLSGGTPTISSFVNLAAAPFNLDTGSFANPRGLDIETASPSHDDEAFGMIGKAGLGGLDISTDGKYLWLVNLKTRTLHKLYLNNPAQPPTNAGDLTTPANQPWLTSNCPNGVERPWAVKTYGDKLYIGTVCTAETSGTAADLSAQVYAYDGTSFAKLLTIPLNYTKGAAYTPAEDPGQWYPWLDVYSDATFNKSGSTVRTQPILSAIEFDASTGNMILGFTDRNGLQFGYQNYKPDGTTNTISGITGGDILLACKSTGAWVVESNGQCPAGSNPLAAGVGDNQGPGNGEFFYDDRQGDASDPTNLTKGVHKDIHVGALAILPGANDVAMTAMDPFRFATGGVAWLYTANGSNERRYEVYQQGTGLAKDRGSFAKSAGLGDLQLLCDPAPIEIGNRVWNDLDGDGVQDAGEPGLPSLAVSLQGPTNTVTVNTDANGLYYFNNLKQYTAYTLTMSVPAGYSLTAANQAALSGASVSSNQAISDTIDSDAALIGGKATIYYSTGSAGQNNHGLDFGFTQPAKGQVDILNTAPPIACMQFSVTLNGSQNTPPTVGPASGSGWVQIDPATNVLTYSITYAGLTGSETMAHIHGFAPRGTAAGILFNLPLGSFKYGTVTFAEADQANLLAGLAYINVHTSTFGGGEIRGQIDGPTTACVAPVATYTLSKTLNTSDPVKPGDPISFTIRITNTGSTLITTLPLSDTYDIRYLQYVSASVAPVDNTDDGRIDWNPACSNLAPTAVCSVVVNFSALHDTTLLAGGATVNRASSGTHTSSASVRINAPTAVAIADKTVQVVDGQVVVQWSTVSETPLLGFHLWREDASGRVARITSNLILAQKPGQSSGAAYRYVDATATSGAAYRYVLELLDTNNQSTYSEVGRVGGASHVYLPAMRR